MIRYHDERAFVRDITGVTLAMRNRVDQAREIMRNSQNFAELLINARAGGMRVQRGGGHYDGLPINELYLHDGGAERLFFVENDPGVWTITQLDLVHGANRPRRNL